MRLMNFSLNKETRKHRVFSIILCAFVFLCSFLESIHAQEPFRVMFYNVENLFDTKNDSLKNDEEFLPEATKKWTYYRYKEKLTKIAKVIVASGNENVPDLVGLSEVENDTCLRDLVKYSPLHEAGYRYVMTDSPDARGIDVALLYQRSSFKLLDKVEIPIPHEKLRRSPTRNILYVSGQVLSGDTLDVFVCHMPSRAGGEEKSEPFRMATCYVLKAAVDAVMDVRQNPNILIMGDFNDYPYNRSLTQMLKAAKPKKKVEPRALYNLMYGMKGGTNRYRGEWGILDQIIVSGTMLQPTNSIRTTPTKAQILRHPFLLEEDDRYGGYIPSRTYIGMRYHGGFSDHLPVCVDLEIGY